MGGAGVIDNFLGVFTSYINSGFGLLGGEVAFIATTLIVIDVTLAALFWSWGAEDDIIARLVKKTLFVGVFAYLIGNWNNLAKIVFDSFAGLGLKASGTSFTAQDLMRPGKVAQTGLDAARPLLAARTVLTAALKRDANGNVNADRLELSSGAVSAGGKASLSDGKVAAELKGALADVSLLSRDAQGAIDLSATARGDLSAPDVSVTVQSGKLSVANREITGLRLDAQGRADLANPAATVSLAGNVAGQKLTGNAVLKTADGKRAIEGLSLSLGPNQVSGDLALDDAFLPDGTVTFKLPDIGPLAALALETAEGDVNDTVRFYKDKGVPQLALKASAGSVRRGDLAVKNASVDALVADYAAIPAISGTVRAEAVNSGGTAITGIAVDLSRDGDGRPFPAAPRSRTFLPRPRAG